jgi:ribosomal protein S4
MVQYLQKTNRNSFTLRNRKLRRLRGDIWGRLAIAGKNDAISRYLMRLGHTELRRMSKAFSREAKRRVYRNFGIPGFMQTFEYSVKVKAEPKPPQRLKARANYFLIRKRLLAYYSMRLRRKSIRKVFKQKRGPSQKKLSFVTRYIPKYNPSNSLSGRYIYYDYVNKPLAISLESRIDVILHRLNFSDCIYAGRHLIRTKRVFVMGPSRHARESKHKINRKFFYCTRPKKHYHKVPLFHFVTLTRDLTLRRKLYLKHMIYSWKLISYPPDYLMVDYGTMIGLRHRNPGISEIRYPFRGGYLSSFLGAALWF